MLKINQKTKPKNAAVVIALKDKLPMMYTSRLAIISKMQGYPVALHVIGRLQRMIDTSSYENLLVSLMKLKEVVRVTADVIDTMEGIRTDKYQLNRTDIAAYVTAVTDSIKTFAPTPEDIDLISHLIIAFEANPAAWMLQTTMSEDNLHLQFKSMYQRVLMDADDGEIPIYLPHTDKIGTLQDMPAFKEVGKIDDKADTADKLSNAATLHRYSAVRIIDHVYSLLMDKDAWYRFIAPRSKAEVGANLERSKTLKVFALYIQNLLSYNQFFMLESFLKGYDAVQKWITHFPPLETSTINKLDNILREHDLLHAREDVNQLWSSFGTTDSDALSPDLVVFPTELLASMGLRTAVAKMESEATMYTAIEPLSELKGLDRPIYLPLFSGVAAANFDVAYDVVNTLLIGKKVSHEVENALASLTPSLVRGASKSTIADFSALGITMNIPFNIPTSLSYSIVKGVSKGLENAKLALDSAAPQFSTDYHEFIRKELTFTTITDDVVPLRYKKFSQAFVFDFDKAQRLRGLLDTDFRSLVPSFLAEGSTIYNKRSLKNDKYKVRTMIEELSHKNFEIFIREMGLPHLRQLWATYFSSFALLYVSSNEATNTGKKAAFNLDVLRLISGHGKPYGVTYSELAARQAQLTPENVDTELIELGQGIFLKILDKIPAPSNQLLIDPSFHQGQPAMYFPASSEDIDVKDFVASQGLLNFSLFPIIETRTVPSLVYTSKFAYLTKGVFLNVEPFYRPTTADPAREVMHIPVRKMEWPFERHAFWLEYITFGSYISAPGLNSTDESDALKIADVITDIESKMKSDNKEQAEAVASSGSAIQNGIKTAANQLASIASSVKPTGEKAAGIEPLKGKSGAKPDQSSFNSKKNSDKHSAKKKFGKPLTDANADVDEETKV